MCQLAKCGVKPGGRKCDKLKRNGGCPNANCIGRNKTSGKKSNRDSNYRH